MDDKAPPDHRRSRPWSDDELMRVDGFKACYSTTLGRIHLVRLPGRVACSVAYLLLAGRVVVMPQTVRTNDYA